LRSSRSRAGRSSWGKRKWSVRRVFLAVVRSLSVRVERGDVVVGLGRDLGTEVGGLMVDRVCRRAVRVAAEVGIVSYVRSMKGVR